jgi:hypothetical protein
MDTERDTETDWQTELYKSRLRLKREMNRALSCISPSSKRALAKEWHDKYSDIFYRELINCAKNKAVAREIADWDVSDFDKKREI